MKVYAVNTAAVIATIPTYTATQLEQVLKCAVLAATLIYTLIKSWNAWKNKAGKDE